MAGHVSYSNNTCLNSSLLYCRTLITLSVQTTFEIVIKEEIRFIPSKIKKYRNLALLNSTGLVL